MNALTSEGVRLEAERRRQFTPADWAMERLNRKLVKYTMAENVTSPVEVKIWPDAKSYGVRDFEAMFKLVAEIEARLEKAGWYVFKETTVKPPKAFFSIETYTSVVQAAAHRLLPAIIDGNDPHRPAKHFYRNGAFAIAIPMSEMRLKINYDDILERLGTFLKGVGWTVGEMTHGPNRDGRDTYDFLLHLTPPAAD